MKLSENVAIALNSQFNYERYSAAVYDALAAHMDFLNLTGFKGYLAKRANEERGHAQKFADYMADTNTKPDVDAIAKPTQILPNDPLIAGRMAFQMALEHEQTVTTRIKALSVVASDDFATHEFLLWFIKEQVEEERTLEEILTKFNLIGTDGTGVVILDKELGG